MPSPKAEDYYEVLQIQPTAPAEVVDAAYKALILRHHPDHGGSTEMAKLLNEARRVLNNPQSRAAFDKQRTRKGEQKAIIACPHCGTRCGLPAVSGRVYDLAKGKCGQCRRSFLDVCAALTCPHCGAMNRVPTSAVVRLDLATCCKCGSHLYEHELSIVCPWCEGANAFSADGLIDLRTLRCGVETCGRPFVAGRMDCPRCGDRMVRRRGKHGPFFGCSNYPRCTGTRDIEEARLPR